MAADFRNDSLVILAKSKENFDAAQELKKIGLNNAVVSRIYYAMFQVVLCDMVRKGEHQLLTDDENTRNKGNSTHLPVHNYLMSQKKDFGKKLRELKGDREKADYGRHCFKTEDSVDFNNYLNDILKIYKPMYDNMAAQRKDLLYGLH